MSTLSRYFHTVRYLRFNQIMARAWFRLHKPRVDLSAAPRLREIRNAYVAPIAPPETLVGPDTFCFLSVRRRCAVPDDWHPRGADKLWIYNLHYFDDWNAADAQSRSVWHGALLERWVKENPPGHGEAWEPYPTSRRIVNWIKWAARGNDLGSGLRRSLAAQTRWLFNRLEYHLLGNHLFANAKALVYAGAYFAGDEAERWRSRGLGIVARELGEQLLADGGHFELSTMYHAAMLEDLLDLVNLERAYGFEVPPQWIDTAARMRRWLHAMSHPDGDIAFFNDSAFGIAPTGTALDEYFARLQVAVPNNSADPLVLLRDSGYVRMKSAPAYLLCDCGSVGPDYLPSHAHADSLSFELSLFGRRLLVNSGTSQYGAGTERQRQRGTAAHNTVVVDGADSSEVWGAFRVARRARTVVHEWPSRSRMVLEASHDGYGRLPGKNEHRRRWTLEPNGLRIEDRISGSFVLAEAFFHLIPGVDVTFADASTVELRWPGGLATLAFEGAVSIDIRNGNWHPRFGVAIGNLCVVARFTRELLETRLTWRASSENAYS